METATTISKISYGIGREYLKHWGIQEALREVYQNFFDFGNYTQIVEETHDPEFVTVKLTNHYQPTGLEFLRIGNSMKDNPKSIGKYGEGLKMAFLIFLRSDLYSCIKTTRFTISPEWTTDNFIGEVLSIYVEENDFESDVFEFTFTCRKEDFDFFNENIISPDDILFSNFYGEIVAKEIGNIYSGNLFVANVKNLTHAYNVNPEFLKLDRDRQTPQSWDVNFYCSKINSDYADFTVQDLSHSDTLYIEKVPEKLYPAFTPVIVGSNVEFTAKNEDTGEEIIVSNQAAVEHLKKSNFFKDAVASLKALIAKTLGIDELLKQFRDKHCRTQEAKDDFDLILKQLNIAPKP